MKENDYSIKPLQGLSNVAGLNPAKNGEGRKKRQKQSKRFGERPGFTGEEPGGLQEDNFDGMIQNDTDDHRIDYCA